MTHLNRLALLALAAVLISTVDQFRAPDAVGESVTPELSCTTLITPGDTAVSGGCLLHATSEGEINIRKHVFGIESSITRCTSEFHGRIDNVGGMYMVEQSLTGTSCSRQPCKAASGEADPWPASMYDSTPPIEGNLEHFGASLCFEPVGGGADEVCHTDIPLDETSPGSHLYEMGHATELQPHISSPFRCEIIAHWTTETGGTHDGSEELELEISL